MRVLVLGAGVVGVASAWFLSRLGFEVSVVDRQNEPAAETNSSIATTPIVIRPAVSRVRRR